MALRRKPGQEIYILVPGRERPIRVTVMGFVPDSGHGAEVRLGFDADNDVEILRHELYEDRGEDFDNDRGNR